MCLLMISVGSIDRLDRSICWEDTSSFRWAVLYARPKQHAQPM